MNPLDAIDLYQVNNLLLRAQVKFAAKLPGDREDATGARFPRLKRGSCIATSTWQ